MVKPDSSKPTLVAPAGGAESAQSGVQLSRQALYLQRMNEIYDDVQAGRCNFDEATDRVVEAIVARTNDWFTQRGRTELAATVRESCARDPRLRKALGGR
jgi:hypothetical protein